MILYLNNIVIVVVVVSVLLLFSCVELMLKKLKITLQKNQEHIFKLIVIIILLMHLKEFLMKLMSEI